MSAIAEVAEGWEGVELRTAAAMRVHAVLDRLGSSESGLMPEEAFLRLAAVGPNAVLSHGARPLQVVLRQLRNPLLILLARRMLPMAVVPAYCLR
jgi:Mg2+-importing ATPase